MDDTIECRRTVRPALLLFVLLLSACQSVPNSESVASGIVSDSGKPPENQLAQCSGLLDQMDELVARQRVQDAQAQRITGYPYLRINRFLASFAQEKPGAEAFDFWLDQLQALDHKARLIEWQNLGPMQSELISRFSRLGTERFEKTIASCSNLLRKRDFAGNAARADLIARIRIRPEYNTWQRILGLYPLTAIFVRIGVDRLQKNVREVFQSRETLIPVAGSLVRYLPVSSQESRHAMVTVVQSEIPLVSNNPLAIPLPSARQQEFLLQKHAPEILVDTASNDDRIGEPYLTRDFRQVRVNTNVPVLYQHISHTRFHGQVLLQLNYIFWFPARTKKSGLDIAAGHLDGITWRVTLSAEGLPLLYDAMHNCGCYHQFFPTERLRLRAQAGEEAEPVLVPQFITATQKPVVRIRSADHFIIRIDSKARAERTVRYYLQGYDTLRSMPVSDSAYTRSMFGTDGVVSGTERLERFLLWPMGVPDPGEMRQWGHHAVTFIGQRHFDDPDLMQRIFEYAQ